MAVHARTFTLAALVLGLTLHGSSPAAAQNDTMVTTTTTQTEEDDSDFPWGLLGLLGLAGLLGRRREKEVHVREHEVHTRPVPPRDDRMGTPPPPPPRP